MPQPSPEDRPFTETFSRVTQDLLAAGISFRFRAIGQSMYPAIRSGEILHVAPLGASKLKRGDIVLFRHKGRFKAHRIIKIKDEMFTTRGDASLQADGEVSREQIIGRVIAKEYDIVGKLVPLAGAGARTKFRLRRLRARMGAWFRGLKLSVLLSLNERARF